MSAPEATESCQAALEEWVRDTCRALGVAMDFPNDDFFAAGATSITAIRLIARAEEEYGEGALPPDDLFEHSSLRNIAEAIARNSPVPWSDGAGVGSGS